MDVRDAIEYEKIVRTRTYRLIQSLKSRFKDGKIDEWIQTSLPYLVEMFEHKLWINYCNQMHKKGYLIRIKEVDEKIAAFIHKV